LIQSLEESLNGEVSSDNNLSGQGGLETHSDGDDDAAAAAVASSPDSSLSVQGGSNTPDTNSGGKAAEKRSREDE